MLKVLGISLGFNSLLLVAAVLVFNAGMTALVLLPVMLLVSILEIAILQSFFRQRPSGEEVDPVRIDAVRRIDYRRKPSIVDDATGLYTRWYFDRRVEEEAARCKRYKHKMAIVVLRVGDVDLTTFSLDGWQKRSQNAAQSAAKVIREVDISASLSPFEFAICLIHCDRDGAYRALDRMMSQLPDYNCEAGVAVYPDEGYEPSALVEIAGARLKPLAVEAAS
jgi:GGDEF domain-containing protein